jgi:hypothetical protein
MLPIYSHSFYADQSMETNSKGKEGQKAGWQVHLRMEQRMSTRQIDLKSQRKLKSSVKQRIDDLGSIPDHPWIGHFQRPKFTMRVRIPLPQPVFEIFMLPFCYHCCGFELS